MKRIEKFAYILRIVGGIAMVLGFMYIVGVAGTSDYENYIGVVSHTTSWLFGQSLIGLSVLLSGFGLLWLSDMMYEESTKKYKKIWVKDLVTGKVKCKYIDAKSSSVILKQYETIFKVGEKIYTYK